MKKKIAWPQHLPAISRHNSCGWSKPPKLDAHLSLVPFSLPPTPCPWKADIRSAPLPVSTKPNSRFEARTGETQHFYSVLMALHYSTTAPLH